MALQREDVTLKDVPKEIWAEVEGLWKRDAGCERLWKCGAGDVLVLSIWVLDVHGPLSIDWFASCDSEAAIPQLSNVSSEVVYNTVYGVPMAPTTSQSSIIIVFIIK